MQAVNSTFPFGRAPISGNHRGNSKVSANWKCPPFEKFRDVSPKFEKQTRVFYLECVVWVRLSTGLNLDTFARGHHAYMNIRSQLVGGMLKFCSNISTGS